MFECSIVAGALTSMIVRADREARGELPECSRITGTLTSAKVRGERSQCSMEAGTLGWPKLRPTKSGYQGEASPSANRRRGSSKFL